MFTGPNISTDGLVLALDAANPKSYPGSGTTWFDISGNANHAYMGGYVSNPIFSTTNGGRFYFNGSTSKSYFDSTTYNGLTNILNCTIIVWAEWVSQATSRYYAFDTRRSTPNTGAGLGFDKESSTQSSVFNFFNDTTGYDEASGPTTYNQNQIYQLGVLRISNTIQVIDTDSQTLISPPLASNTLGTNAISQLGNYRVGSYSDAVSGTTEYWWAGYIYAVRMYNRNLSQEEITQNYNAMKSRFNL